MQMDTLIYKCEKPVKYKSSRSVSLRYKMESAKRIINSILNIWTDPCEPGCMSLFDDAGDTEYLQEYNYSKKYDDWILTRDEEVLKYENNKEVNKLSDVNLIGISGKKYKIKKMTKIK